MPRILGKDPDTKDNVLYEHGDGNVESMTRDQAIRLVNANKPNSNNPASQIQPGNQPLNAPNESQSVYEQVNAETDEFAQGGALSNPNAQAGIGDWIEENIVKPTGEYYRGAEQKLQERQQQQGDKQHEELGLKPPKQQPELTEEEQRAAQRRTEEELLLEQAQNFNVPTTDKTGNQRPLEDIRSDLQAKQGQQAAVNDARRRGKELVIPTDPETGLPLENAEPVEVDVADATYAEDHPGWVIGPDGQLHRSADFTDQSGTGTTKVGTQTTKETITTGPTQETAERLGEAQDKRFQSQMEELQIGVEGSQAINTMTDRLLERRQQDIQYLHGMRQKRNERVRKRNALMQQQLDELTDMSVDPNNIFSGNGAAVFGAALSVGVGQLLNQLYDIPNNAQALIDQAIERDIDAQKFNIRKAERDYARQGSLYDRMTQVDDDEILAEEKMRAAMYGVAAKRLQNRAAKVRTQQEAQKIQTMAAANEEKKAAAQAKAEQRTMEIETERDLRVGSQRVDTSSNEGMGSMTKQERKDYTQTRERFEEDTIYRNDKAIKLTYDRQKIDDKGEAAKAAFAFVSHGPVFVKAYNDLINFADQKGKSALVGEDRADVKANIQRIIRLRGQVYGAGALSEGEVPELKQDLIAIGTEFDGDTIKTLPTDRDALLKVLRKNRNRDVEVMSNYVNQIYRGNPANVVFGGGFSNTDF